ncbi:MAG: hemerythrin domain-containing protein [Rubrivivax sp.]|nr:hemerythrin domain-containing protein [Rubrivivax sp.]
MLMTDATTRDTLTDAVAANPRLQPYRLIHKALRALMFHTLQRVAALDAARVDDRAAMQAAVDELLQVCADHLAHETRFYHAPLRERAPRAVLPFDDDHGGHEITITALRTRMAQVAAGGAGARAEAYALYLELTRFIAENLEHMADEETQLTQALWQHFSDAEIAAMGDRLRATFSAQESTYYLRWMARALDDAELAALAGDARAGMPPEVFAGVLGLT